MRRAMTIATLLGPVLAGVSPTSSPVLAQSTSHGLFQQQPSEQDIERFCGNWGQLSGTEKKQYRDQYEHYCRDEPVFGQPVAPQLQTPINQPAEPSEPQQPQLQPQQPQEPQMPADPEASEPEIQPTRPEAAIPEPEPLRMDLAGELRLDGPLARQPGEHQRLQVTVKNRGAGGGPHAPAVNRLWARVFLSDQDLSRRGRSARSYSFPARQPGRQVRLPAVPGPGQFREVMTEVVLPVTLADGNYWWCVQVDTRQQIEETDEGNNTACAQKVVAIGGESGSELSGVFGSKVDEVKEQADRPGAGSELAGGGIIGSDVPMDYTVTVPVPSIAGDRSADSRMPTEGDAGVNGLRWGEVLTAPEGVSEPVFSPGVAGREVPRPVAGHLVMTGLGLSKLRVFHRDSVLTMYGRGFVPQTIRNAGHLEMTGLGG